MDKINSVLDQVNGLASHADEVTRKKLMVMLRDAAYALEGPDDTVHRIGYLHLQSAAVRIGIDLELFELLTSREDSMSLSEIVDKLKGDSIFLGRLLRYLSSVGMISESNQGAYTANNVTRKLAVKGNQAGICHCFDTIGPQYQEMPNFMKKIGYQNVEENYHTVFQDAWKTELGAFEWFDHHPNNLDYFNQYMASRREGAETWLSVYPVEAEAKTWDSEALVYVNIGGSIGHQCAEFKAKYPQLPGRVINQDLSHSIDKALRTPGVENMVHDFFQPQPIKGAKFYFLRGVLHNHPDERVRLILLNIKIAMGKDSVLLIDEMVLPDTQVDWHVTSIDLTMMCAFAARERTETQWNAILESVGLKLVKKLTYKPSVYESVMATVPK